MLSDFLTLEAYFGYEGSAQFLEEVSKRYSAKTIQTAVSAGDLIQKTVLIGPDKGRSLLWLSEQGRQKQQSRIHI